MRRFGRPAAALALALSAPAAAQAPAGAARDCIAFPEPRLTSIVRLDARVVIAWQSGARNGCGRRVDVPVAVRLFDATGAVRAEQRLSVTLEAGEAMTVRGDFVLPPAEATATWSGIGVAHAPP